MHELTSLIDNGHYFFVRCIENRAVFILSAKLQLLLQVTSLHVLHRDAVQVLYHEILVIEVHNVGAAPHLRLQVYLILVLLRKFKVFRRNDLHGEPVLYWHYFAVRTFTDLCNLLELLELARLALPVQQK